MLRRTIPLIAFVAGLSACGTADAPTAPPLGTEAGFAKGGGGGGGPVLYRAQLIVETETGEITSDPFPAAGFSVSASNPWKQVSFSNVTLNLSNSTNGDWGDGQCAVFDSNFGLPYSKSFWDIGNDPNVTYAGTWKGTVTFGKGYFAFDGDRLVDSVVRPDLGGIHNVVTQSNPTVETVASDKSWFRQQVRNAPFKFGSASAPNGTLLPNAEVACVNYTIVLQKVVTP